MSLAEPLVHRPEPRSATDVPMADPIAIVGLGAYFPGAADVDAYWRNIVGGVDATSEVPADRWGPEFYDTTSERPDRFYCRRGGFVSEPSFDAAAFGVMPLAVDDAEPDQLLALQVASKAVTDAGGLEGRVDPERVGVVLGRGGYLTAGMARLDQRVRGVNQVMSVLTSVLPDLAPSQLAMVEQAFRDQLGPDRPEAAIGLVPNLAASRIANRLDLRGPAFTVDGACASSLLAVEHAVHALRSKRCDVMLAGGVHHCHDVTFWSVFAQLGALSRSQRIRPFDAAADGLLIGEGTGVVVLKRLVDAEADGDRVYAVIRGVGSSSDGRASSLMKPRVSGQALALTRAWGDAGLDPATVGLVEAHGTATPAGDAAELATLAQVFGPADHRPRAGLGSVKSMIGHTMPAAGVAGLIKAALAVHHRTLPPSLGCDDPHAELESTRFRMISAAEPWARGDAPRRAAVNAFGFGGINAHVVLEEWAGTPDDTGGAHEPATDAPATSAPDRPHRTRVTTVHEPDVTRPLLLRAASLDDLRSQLDRPDPDLLAEAAFTPPTGTGPVRLALAEPGVERLALARKVVDRGRPWRGRSDLWFTADPLLGEGGGKVAFCHPGVEPTFEPRIDDVVDHFGLPAFEIGDGSVNQQARAIVHLGRALHQVFARLDVVPDLEFGHSVGEWTAMATTGHVPPTAVDDFIANLDVDTLTVADAWYVALGCAAVDAQDLVAGMEHAVVSHDNCPHQSMVCADAAGADEVLERARSRRILAQKLPFRSGFHSPFLADHLGPFTANLDRLPLAPPHTPLWSATTGTPYPHDAAAVRELTLRHLVEPVRFTSLVQRLHETEGVRAVVQVGTGSTTGFVDDALRGRDVLTISANDPKRSGMAQLTRVAAALWTEGLTPRWDRLASTQQADTVGAVFGAAPDPLPSPAAPIADPPPRREPVALRLGAPLVSLSPSVVLSTGNGHHSPVVASSPALAHAFDDVMTTIGAATTDVLRSFESPAHPVRRRAAAPARTGAPSHRPSPPSEIPPAAVAPVGGPPNGNGNGNGRSPDGHLPEGTTARTVPISCEALPWVLDHCFYRQPDGWADVRDRFPVVPMTTMVEMMMAEAVRAHPGRVVVAMRKVQALKWLAASPATEVTIRTAPVPDHPDQVKVAIDGHARAVAVLADAYPAAPPATLSPLTDPRASERSAAAMYAERMMFHGPAFQGVTELTRVGSDGIDGDLVSLPAPGALLDSTGQVMGYWMMISTDADRLALPVAIGELAFHGPHPPSGTPVSAAVRITALTPKLVEADHELSVDGTVWCRITGWQDRRFQTDDKLWPTFTHPEENLLTEPQPGGWDLVRERWPDAASRELVLRRYTTALERAHHDTLTPRDQRTWLLGRVAAKDAVRRQLREHDARPIFPVELPVTNDPSGRPEIVVPAPHDAPQVSLAHVDRVAVAWSRASGPCGIDIAAVDDGTDHVAALALTPEERALVPAAPPTPDRGEAPEDGACGERGERGTNGDHRPNGTDARTTAIARLWAVKEAAGKATGAGLAGRPRDLTVVGVDDTVHQVRVGGIHRTPPAVVSVDTTVIDIGDRRYAVAWTIGSWSTTEQIT